MYADTFALYMHAICEPVSGNTTTPRKDTILGQAGMFVALWFSIDF